MKPPPITPEEMAIPDHLLPPDPENDPNLRRVWRREGYWAYEPVRKPRKPKPQASPELIAEMVKLHPMPSPIPKNSRHVAKQQGDLYYWAHLGCKYHGSPALRYTSAGNCVMCTKDLAKDQAAVNREAKLSRQTPLDHLPVSWADAIAARTKHYFDGKPCRKAGHIAVHYTRNRACLACLAESQGREYKLPPLSSELPSGVAPRPPRQIVEPPKATPSAPRTAPAPLPTPRPAPPPEVSPVLQQKGKDFMDDLDRRLGLTRDNP